MVLTSIKKDGCVIPVYTNSKAIVKHTLLLKYKAKVIAEAADANAKVVVESTKREADAAGKGGNGGKSGKRAKKI